MTPRLTRSLLLAAGIAVLATSVFYWFFNESKLLQQPRFRFYSGEINVRLGIVGDTASTPYNIQKSLSIIEQRLAKSGYGYELKNEQDHSFTFSFDALKDTVEVASLITSNGDLAMYEVYTMDKLVNPLMQIDTIMAAYLKAKPDDLLLRQTVSSPIRMLEHPVFAVLESARPYNNDGGGAGAYPGYIGLVLEKDTAFLRQLLRHPVVTPLLPVDTRFMFEEKNAYTSSAKFTMLYALRYYPPRITSRNITEAHVEFDIDTNEPIVIVELDAYGAREFERLTTSNIGKPIAICMNDKVVQAPIVNQPISGGHLRITFGLGKEAVGYSRAMSTLFTSQGLPVRVQVNRTKFSYNQKGAVGTGSYALVFVLAFALAMGAQWLIARISKS